MNQLASYYWPYTKNDIYNSFMFMDCSVGTSFFLTPAGLQERWLWPQCYSYVHSSPWHHSLLSNWHSHIACVGFTARYIVQRRIQHAPCQLTERLQKLGNPNLNPQSPLAWKTKSTNTLQYKPLLKDSVLCSLSVRLFFTAMTKTCTFTAYSRTINSIMLGISSCI